MTKHAIIIGAQRSGSTSLYEMLKQNEEVYSASPDKPEPKFFLNPKASHSEYLAKYFPNVSLRHKLLLEKSTSYYEQKAAVAERINDTLDHVKCLMILRNPINRALSNYKFSVKHGLESRTMEEVFIQKKEHPKVQLATSVDPFDYLGRGDYSKFILRFRKVFGEDLKVVIMEDMHLKSEVDSIHEFLDLSLESTAAFPALNSTNNDGVSSAVMNTLKEYYTPKIQELSELLNKDLTSWRH